MGRRLFSFTAGVSLLLFLATVVLWVRSSASPQKPVDRVIFTFPDRRLWEFTSAEGVLGVVTLHRWPNCEPVRFFAAPESRFVGGFMPWDCPQYKLGFVIDHRWHDFGWASGVGYTQLNSDGSAGWSKKLFWVDDPPPLSGSMDFRAVCFPFWSIALGTVMAPLIYVTARTANLRRREALRRTCRCRNCAYNLTGNTSGTCPECGTAIPKASESKN